MRLLLFSSILSLLMLPCHAQKHTSILGGELGANVTPTEDLVSNLAPGIRTGVYFDHFFTQDFGMGTGLFYYRTGERVYLGEFFGPNSGQGPQYNYLFFDGIEIPLRFYLRLSHGTNNKADGFIMLGYAFGYLLQTSLQTDILRFYPRESYTYPMGEIKSHSLHLGFKIDHHLKNEMELSWGVFANGLVYGAGYYYRGIANFNVFLRLGKILGQKES